MSDLSVYRATDRIAINPYSFDAGNGPGNDTVNTIVALAKASGCELDAGWSGGPFFLTNLPKDDAELESLLELAQIR
jgi:hypothetical protein